MVLRRRFFRWRFLDASLLLRRWRFGRRRNFWNLVGSRNGQGWGLHLRRKLRFVFFARSARQQQQQCHQKESELAPQCHPKWNAATISYSGSTAKLASRGEQAYDNPARGATSITVPALFRCESRLPVFPGPA